MKIYKISCKSLIYQESDHSLWIIVVVNLWANVNISLLRFFNLSFVGGVGGTPGGTVQGSGTTTTTTFTGVLHRAIE